jgi:SNF family Na+-dependent transporter
MTSTPLEEHWRTRVGVILAVAGSAVGLGNFLRFPGRAALYGGGSFMIPYFVSLVLLGIPICIVEWTLGRHGGRHGHHSAPGIYRTVTPHGTSRAFGALAVFIPVVIYTYYVCIEAWCLGYAWSYLTGGIDPGPDPAAYPQYFAARFDGFVGTAEDGAAFGGSPAPLVVLCTCLAVNLAIVARGLTRGIERLCLWAMPVLLVAALVILARVLTLGTPDPSHPEQSVLNGLGFMWNPKPAGGGGTFSALADPVVWLEAAGQVFFTLSVGFGIIATYASYLRPDDDVVLSGLSACATNEFCEVCLGGLITIPAAFVFLGALPLAGVAGSSIALGFHAVPVVFEHLPLADAWGALWFGLLFLAAVTSSVSMLQPALAFLAEGLGLGRRAAVTTLGLITAAGALLVAWGSRDMLALSVMDFWVGSTLLLVLALFEVLLFGWVLGAERGLAEANRGSDVRLPRAFGPLVRWVCPAYLILILGGFLLRSATRELQTVLEEPVAALTAGFLCLTFGASLVAAHRAWGRWARADHARGAAA